MKYSEFLEFPEYDKSSEPGMYRLKNQGKLDLPYPFMVFFMKVEYDYETQIIDNTPVAVWVRRWRAKNEIIDGA